MRREHALTAIEGLGSEFELDTLVERLIFIEKIEEGMKDLREGRTLSNEEMKARIAGWKTEAHNPKPDSDAA